MDFEFTDKVGVNLIQQVGGDHLVIAAARVSVNAVDSLQWARDEHEKENFGLINFMMKMRHGSVFEHSTLTFFVDAPIMVFREWMRHRIGMSYNEASGRWSELRPKFWIPGRDRPMVQGPDYKPSRPKLSPIVEDKDYEIIVKALKESHTGAYKTYKGLIGLGIAKEVARSVLGVAIYSQCYVTCNPRSLMHFLSLRVHDPEAKYVSYPQWEIQVAAKACEEIFSVGWPLTYKAFVTNGRVGP